MSDSFGASTGAASSIPPDDPQRAMVIARPETDDTLPHLGVVGDTYTILLTGEDTAGRYCLIDMHIPPGGGPPPHRHDFEETFVLLVGELEATFRGVKQVVRAGETIHIPANAPHQFRNVSASPARALCTCAPAGIGCVATPITCPYLRTALPGAIAAVATLWPNGTGSRVVTSPGRTVPAGSLRTATTTLSAGCSRIAVLSRVRTVSDKRASIDT